MDVWTCSALTFSKHFLHSSAQKSLHPHLCLHTSTHAHYWFANQGHNPHIPRFSFEIDEKSNSINFYPFWTDLIHFGQIWSNLMKKEIVIFIHMVQSTMYSTELHISSKSNSFVLFVKLSTAENSGFFNQHTELRSHCCQQFSCIIWSCFDTETADNCGILT